MKHIRFFAICLMVGLCTTACGKTASVSDTPSEPVISDLEEISFQVISCNPQAVTYTVGSSKENFLFYEGHGFAYIQKHVDGSWYSLVPQPQDSTGDFQWVSIPAEEQLTTIRTETEYGGKLETGTYRLVAPCSFSAAPPEDAEPGETVYLAAEFEIS